MHWNAVRNALLLIAFSATTLATTTWASDDPDDCSIAADNDVYGIGIRLGFYFQFVSALITTLMTFYSVDPGDANSIRVANNIISLAVLVNSLKSSDDKNLDGGLLALEFYIAIAMTLGLGVLGGPPEDAVDTATGSEEKTVALGISQLLFALWCFLQPWIAFDILERKRVKDHCSITFFFFAPLDVRQKATRILTKVGAIASCPLGAWHLYSAFKTFKFLVIWVRNRARSQPPTRRGTMHVSEGETVQIPKKNHFVQHLRGLGHQSTLTAFFQLAVGTVAIALNEKTIRTNNFTFDDGGILSSGQLIPFLVGLFSIIERSKCLVKLAWVSANEAKRTKFGEGSEPKVLMRLTSRKDKARKRPHDEGIPAEA